MESPLGSRMILKWFLWTDGLRRACSAPITDRLGIAVLPRPVHSLRGENFNLWKWNKSIPFPFFKLLYLNHIFYFQILPNFILIISGIKLIGFIKLFKKRQIKFTKLFSFIYLCLLFKKYILLFKSLND